MESSSNHLNSSSSSSSYSSTFATDLFGSDDTSSSSVVFGSIFSPSTTKATIRDELGSDAAAAKKQDTQGRGVVEGGYKSLDSIFDSDKGKAQQQQQPCHLSSSIYYGGQDIYSNPHSSQSSKSVTFKKDGDEMTLTVPLEETGGKGHSTIERSSPELIHKELQKAQFSSVIPNQCFSVNNMSHLFLSFNFQIP